MRNALPIRCGWNLHDSATTLHEFSGSDGWAATGLTYIQSKLIGGTSGGGASNYGTLFSIHTDGTSFALLHSFDGQDGSGQTGTMVSEKSGAIGISPVGGIGYQAMDLGEGTLFYVGLDGHFEVLHYFQNGDDGKYPNWLTSDRKGNVFGSTQAGGASHDGTIFEYAPSTKTYKVIYTFNGKTDGETPMVGAVGADGTIYGATANSKPFPNGTLFALTPGPGGYSYTNIAIFQSDRGDRPYGPPALLGTDTLVGNTYDFIYTFRNGQLRLVQEFADTVPSDGPLAPVTASRTDFIYGAGGGASLNQPCAVPNLRNVCGLIFTFKP